MVPEREQGPNRRPPKLTRLLTVIWLVAGVAALLSPFRLDVVWVLLATFLSFAVADEHAARVDDVDG